MKRNFDRETVYLFSDSEIGEELSKRVKRLRLSSCMSQTEFAQRSGVSLSTIRRAESGGILELSLANLVKVLRAGGMLDGVAELIEDVPVYPALYRPITPKRMYASSKMRDKYERE